MDDGIWGVHEKYCDGSSLSLAEEIRYGIDCRVNNAYGNIQQQLAGPQNMSKLGVADKAPIRQVRKTY
uniref:Uncharacterized protein n=1 Tax=Panagrolaimus sp. PS1159 TaxID=55785 RepID=A0AC35GAL0_9BILA